MKTCSYCGATNDDTAAVCSGCGTSSFGPAKAKSRPRFGRWLSSIWSLRIGSVLALLPIPALGASCLYLHHLYSTWSGTGRRPEDYMWSAIFVTFGFICFSGTCLFPSIALLLLHVRRSRMARWVLACAAIQMFLILALCIYIA